jgi:hypothetical protein
MATRARIGLQKADGTVIASYQHWDGYTGGLGYNLCDNWTDMNKVKSAIELGDASVWGIVIGTKTDFDDRNSEAHDYQNIYYGRDRGEKDCQYLTYRNEQVYLMNGFLSGEEYIYLIKDTGKQDYLGRPKGEWFYAKREWNESKKDYDDAKRFLPLEEEALEDRIRILQSTLKMIRDSKRKVA